MFNMGYQNNPSVSRGFEEVAGGEVGKGDIHYVLHDDTEPPICILSLNQGAYAHK